MREPGEDLDAYIERRITEALGGYKITTLDQLPLAALRRWTEDEVNDDAYDSRAVDESVVHVGEVRCTARAAAPQGWLLCQGQSLSTTNYAALFSAIGYTYGGAGASFTLPDLRGRVPIGSGTGSGLSARTLGANVGGENIATGDLPAHNHPVTDPGHDHAFESGSQTFTTTTVGLAAGGGSTTLPLLGYNDTASRTTGVTVGNTGGTGNGSRMQPSQVLNYIIKY